MTKGFPHYYILLFDLILFYLFQHIEFYLLLSNSPLATPVTPEYRIEVLLQMKNKAMYTTDWKENIIEDRTIRKLGIEPINFE